MKQGISSKGKYKERNSILACELSTTSYSKFQPKPKTLVSKLIKRCPNQPSQQVVNRSSHRERERERERDGSICKG